MSVTAEERAKALAKIKKCLALSASPEPHEAAAAMRQAQKMMAALGVTAEEVEAPDIAEAVVKTREGFGNCRYMNLLASLIEEAFGVEVLYSRNPGSAHRLNVKYIGPRAKALLAQYTHVVMQQALEGAWRFHLDLYPYDKQFVGARSSFYMGWLWAVEPQVQAMVPSEVETAAIGRFMALRYPDVVPFKERKAAELDKEALLRGMKAAAAFSIRTPMTQEQLKIGRG